MAYPIEVKLKAIEHRKCGYSINEIAKIFGIAQSTASLWLRDIILDRRAKKRLRGRRVLGQYKTALIRARKRNLAEVLANKQALQMLSKFKITPEIAKSMCALLFWAEGAKHLGCVQFINSDPRMISTFLKLFRRSFPVQEKKFKVLVHIQDYHIDYKIRKFWSKTTDIPFAQFSKSYRKPHTKIRKKPGYQGCIRISYYDSKIAQELKSIYNSFAETL